jgi:hypothetical protein
VTSNSDLFVGATAQEKFRVLSFGVKIQDLALIGCAWQSYQNRDSESDRNLDGRIANHRIITIRIVKS